MSLPITLTPAAISFYKRCLHDQKRKGVHFSVSEEKGCAPLRYIVNLINEPKPSDLNDCLDGLNVSVDLNSTHHLHGLTVDLKQQGLNQKVIFQHPRAKTTCGCGETFSLDTLTDASPETEPEES
jgi:iron-sulfur cluster assembly accessory protein